MALCAAVLAGCGASKTPPANPGVAVQAAHLNRAEIQQEIVSDAVLYPLHEAAIIPTISAPVQKFYVQRGDRVSAGELVAELVNGDLVAKADQAKGAYD